MGVKEYFIFSFPILVFELLAAVAGTFYLKKAPVTSLSAQYLVYYIWVVFLIDTLGTYAVIGYFSEYEYFSFVKDTVAEKNIWLSNIYLLLTPLFVGYYFSKLMPQKLSTRLIRYISITFLIGGIVDVFILGNLFTSISVWSSLFGAFLVFVSTVLYFFELLRSDSILNLKYHLPLYFAIGILIFYLCVTPLTIFSDYFSVGKGNKLFVNLQVHIILYANIFMYSCFTLGFLICSRKKKFS